MPYSLQRFGLDTTGKTILHLGPNLAGGCLDSEANPRPRLHLVAGIVPKPYFAIACDATVVPLKDPSV